MTRQHGRKQQIRQRMAATGEPYHIASAAIDDTIIIEPAGSVTRRYRLPGTYDISCQPLTASLVKFDDRGLFRLQLQPLPPRAVSVEARTALNHGAVDSWFAMAYHPDTRVAMQNLVPKHTGPGDHTVFVRVTTEDYVDEHTITVAFPGQEDDPVHRAMRRQIVLTSQMVQLESEASVRAVLHRDETEFGEQVPALVAAAADAWDAAFDTNYTATTDDEEIDADAHFVRQLDALTAATTGDRDVALMLVTRWLLNGKKPYQS